MEYCVNYYDDEGRDYDKVFDTFHLALNFYLLQVACLEEEGFHTMRASPTLSDENGNIWNHETWQWEET